MTVIILALVWGWFGLWVCKKISDRDYDKYAERLKREK